MEDIQSIHETLEAWSAGRLNDATAMAAAKVESFEDLLFCVALAGLPLPLATALRLGLDDGLRGHLTSAMLACGFDALHIRKSLWLDAATPIRLAA
ncbi:hypothetical protein [Aureimonas sp. AU12]|uniref:hypothetical protein n=1 Tax=Aureimonas sp. AU12 TaxID=1638161 RepID=UPI0007811344|nr:hypothetical protein [Aureimonas sp. AU12]